MIILFQVSFYLIIFLILFAQNYDFRYSNLILIIFKSINRPMGVALINTTTPGQHEPDSNGNKEVDHRAP